MKSILVLIFIGAFSFLSDNLFLAKTSAALALTVVENNDPDLKFGNGILFYKHKAFSGTIIEKYITGIIHQKKTYNKGREDGWQYSYYETGAIKDKRYYKNGEKDGINYGWWPNGNNRFEYHFKNGVYDGYYKEWYADGKRYKSILYAAGKDVSGKGWRESGKLFMNFVTIDGRRYGIENSNLCYSLKEEIAQ